MQNIHIEKPKLSTASAVSKSYGIEQFKFGVISELKGAKELVNCIIASVRESVNKN